MAVGLPAGKWDIDNRAGTVVKVLRDALRDVEAFNAYLTEMDATELEAVGYTADDVTLLKAAFFDLVKLSRISHGQDSQPEPNDFFWNAKHLLGPA